MIIAHGLRMQVSTIVLILGALERQIGFGNTVTVSRYDPTGSPTVDLHFALLTQIYQANPDVKITTPSKNVFAAFLGFAPSVSGLQAQILLASASLCPNCSCNKRARSFGSAFGPTLPPSISVHSSSRQAQPWCCETFHHYALHGKDSPSSVTLLNAYGKCTYAYHLFAHSVSHVYHTLFWFDGPLRPKPFWKAMTRSRIIKIPFLRTMFGFVANLITLPTSLMTTTSRDVRCNIDSFLDVID
jgi:hypothetical protein